MAEGTKRWGWWALILLLSGVWYSALGVPFVYDDLAEIVTNTSLHHLDKPLEIIRYNPARPLLLFTFALDWYLWGTNTLPYHLENIALHLLNVVGVVWLAGRLLRGRTMGSTLPESQQWIPPACGLLFAVHPLFVESVTYIASRSSTLCATFYVATLWAFSTYRDRQAAGAPAARWYAATLVFMLLAVASKEEAATIPGALLLFDLTLTPPSSVEVSRRYLPHVAPWLVLLSMVGLRYFAFGDLISGPQVRSPAEHLWTSLGVIVAYARRFVVPWPLSIYHDVPTVQDPFTLQTATLLILHTTLLGVAVRGWRRSKVWAFPIFWFYLTLLPTSSLIPLKEAMAEHRAYLPGIGVVASLGLLLVHLPQGVFTKGVMVGLAGSLAALTWQYNQVWQDEVTLWTHTTTLAPSSGDAYYALGDALRRRGEYAAARTAYETAIKNYEDKGAHLPPPMGGRRIVLNYPDALNNLGLVMAMSGDLGGAIQQFRKTTRTVPEHSASAWTNLGFALMNRGEYREAESALQQAILREPDNVLAHLHLANLYYGFLQDRPRALQQYQTVLALAPDHPHKKELEQRILELSY